MRSSARAAPRGVYGILAGSRGIDKKKKKTRKMHISLLSQHEKTPLPISPTFDSSFIHTDCYINCGIIIDDMPALCTNKYIIYSNDDPESLNTISRKRKKEEDWAVLSLYWSPNASFKSRDISIQLRPVSLSCCCLLFKAVLCARSSNTTTYGPARHGLHRQEEYINEFRDSENKRLVKRVLSKKVEGKKKDSSAL